MNNLKDKKSAKHELFLGSISACILVLLFTVSGWEPIGIVGLSAVLLRLAHLAFEV